MDPQNTPFTVQLGRGANIRLANAEITTGNDGATIHFGNLHFPINDVRVSPTSTAGMTICAPIVRPQSTEALTRRARRILKQGGLPDTATTEVVEVPRKRTSVFDRLSTAETPTFKRTVVGRTISVVPVNSAPTSTESFAPGRHDVEASSSGVKLSRKQRRKRNAVLRAQQLMPEYPVIPQDLQPEASVPTRNKYENLKWVKRNSSTGELKQSFWDQRHEVPIPQKKKPETLSARVHRVLKVAKEEGLMKKKYQRPTIREAQKAPPTNLPSIVVRRAPYGEHRSVTIGPQVRESAIERSRRKGKQIWRPTPRIKESVDSVRGKGPASHAHPHRPTIDRTHKKWVAKKMSPDKHPLVGRHLGESSKGSHRDLNSPPREETNFDRSPPIEESFVPHAEPEVQWRRRSQIRIQEEEDAEESMDIEVVYMVQHGEPSDIVRYQTRRRRAVPPAPAEGQEEAEGSPSSSSGDEQEEEQPREENPTFTDATTLAQAQKQIQRQMKNKDKEIAQLSAKMNEMMAQMNLMMEMMQKNAAAVPVPVQPVPPANHQASSSAPVNPPIIQAPQTSGVRGSHEGGVETTPAVLPPVPPVTSSTSEPVTAAQLETIINEKIKAVIALEQAEKFISKGRPYPAEYDQVPYPKGYSVPKFNTFNGTGNPKQHLAQFKATCGNTGGNDALLFRQFVSSLISTAFEWYVELPNDSVKTFAELEVMFVKRFASATEKTTIADLALEKRRRDESVTKYISRWRNMSMKCEQQLEEEHAVQLLMGNIEDKMVPYLCMASITTFQELLDRVAKFEKLNLSKLEGHSDRFKRSKAPDMRKGDVQSIAYNTDKGKRVVYNVDKGKQPAYNADKGKQTVSVNPPPKLVLGGNDKPRTFPSGGERPRQTTGFGDRNVQSLKERLNKEYSFKRESVAKLFRQALKAGLELPECKRPDEEGQTNNPNYCPYHRVVSHPIEDCYIFKDWLERKYKKGEFTLSDNVLVRPRRESTRVITSSPTPPDNKKVENSTQGEEWEIVVSKKTTKMLKQLEGIPEVT